MRNSHPYKKLLYEHEALRAQLEIREQYLQSITRQVYENIGQILTLVRIQLRLLTPENPTKQKEQLEESGGLVSHAIRDLRNMCRSFYPDANLFTTEGFIEAVQHELNSISPEARINLNGDPKPIEKDTSLILFRILQQIFNAINECKPESIIVEMNFNEDLLEIIIDSKKQAPDNIIQKSKEEAAWTNALDIIKRAKLISGKLHMSKRQKNGYHIKFVIPIHQGTVEV
jgi:two-component system, NarL family, sensor kinase